MLKMKYIPSLPIQERTKRYDVIAGTDNIVLLICISFPPFCFLSKDGFLDDLAIELGTARNPALRFTACHYISEHCYGTRLQQ